MPQDEETVLADARGTGSRGTGDRGVETADDEDARRAEELDLQNGLWIRMLYKDFAIGEGLTGVRGLIHNGINLHRNFLTGGQATRYWAAEALMRLYALLAKRAAEAPTDPEDDALLLRGILGDWEPWIPEGRSVFGSSLSDEELPPPRPASLDDIPPFIPANLVLWNDALIEGPPPEAAPEPSRRKRAPKKKYRPRPGFQRNMDLTLPDGSRVEISPVDPSQNRIVLHLMKMPPMALDTEEGRAAIIAAVVRRLADYVTPERALEVAYAIGLGEKQALVQNITNEEFKKKEDGDTFTYDFGPKFLDAVEQHVIVDPRFREKLVGGVKIVKDQPRPIWRPLFPGYPVEERIFWAEQQVQKSRLEYARNEENWRLLPGEMYQSGVFLGYGMSFDDEVWLAPDCQVYAVNQREAMLEAFRVGVLQSAGAVILAYIMIGAATAALAPASVNMLISITQLIQDPPKGGVGDILLKLPLGGQLTALKWSLRLTSDIADIKGVYDAVKNGDGALVLFMLVAQWAGGRMMGKKPTLPDVPTVAPGAAKMGRLGAPDVPKTPDVPGGVRPPAAGKLPDAPDVPQRGKMPDGADVPRKVDVPDNPRALPKPDSPVWDRMTGSKNRLTGDQPHQQQQPAAQAAAGGSSTSGARPQGTDVPATGAPATGAKMSGTPDGAPAGAKSSAAPDAAGGSPTAAGKGAHVPRAAGGAPKYRKKPAAAAGSRGGRGSRGAPASKAKAGRGGKSPAPVKTPKRSGGGQRATGGKKNTNNGTQFKGVAPKNKGVAPKNKTTGPKNKKTPAPSSKTPAAQKGGRQVAPHRRSLEVGPSKSLVGQNTRQFARDAIRLIRSKKDHKLKFLLDKVRQFKKFKKTRGKKHSELSDEPDLVQMGHVGSAKGKGKERIVLQDAHFNQLDNVSIESKPGVVRESMPVVDVDGVAVEMRTAKQWEKEGLLVLDDGMTVDDLPRLDDFIFD